MGLLTVFCAILKGQDLVWNVYKDIGWFGVWKWLFRFLFQKGIFKLAKTDRKKKQVT